MSLGVAIFGFIFLFFLIVSLYFAWGEFFSVTDQKTTKQTEILEDSPEWRAFLSRRQEIENDPTLDEQSKKVLTDNWLVMASESKPHMAAPHNQMFKNPNWAKPSMLFLMMGSSLVLAGAFSYSIGAVYPSAFSNSSPSVDQVDQAATASTGHPGDGVSLQERLAGLQKKLEDQPSDLSGWVLLARTHASMSNYVESANALKKALELTPGHPDVLADLADMLAMAQGRQLAGEPEKYIALALQSDPRHEKALALAASAAEQVGDNKKAQVYWQLLSQVQQASLKNTAPPPAQEAIAEPATSTANSLANVKVNVPQLAWNGLNNSSALFVFLKAEPGPGMPIAVVRVPVLNLSVGDQTVQIGPSDFIQEGGVAGLPETVYVQARLSVQGIAQASPGDMQSTWLAVKRDQLASGISLAIPAHPANP